jgi:DHA1 family tetracycline resistance protein-like MFS transporter
VRRSQLFNIFFTVFIGLVGFGLIMPLIPYYVAEYGGSEFLVGLLVASYAAAQFVGSPLLGRMSDRRGRRPILALCMAGTTLGFLLLALAEPLGKALASLLAAGAAPAPVQAQNAAILGVMFFSRILSGLSGGAITVAQAYIADVTDEHNRTMGMGLIGAAFGLGFIVGPVMGGVLSQWGYAAPAFVATGLGAMNMIAILVMLPESLTEERKAELSSQAKQRLIDIQAMFRKLGKPRIGPLLSIRLFSSLAGALFFTLFTLWAKDRLGADAQVTSYLMAYTGVLSIVAQVGLINPLEKRFSQARLITWSTGVLAAALLAWAFTPSIPVMMLVMIPHALASGVLNTVINSAISWAVPPQEMGDALGTSSALESLSRIIAPSLGGWLLGAVGTWAPGVLGAALMGGLAVFARQRLILHPDPPLGESVLLEQEVPEALPTAPIAS